MFTRLSRLFALATVLLTLSGCTVVKAVDLAASTAIGVTAGAVKVTGKAVGAAIPDGDDEKQDKDGDPADQD